MFEQELAEKLKAEVCKLREKNFSEKIYSEKVNEHLNQDLEDLT